MLFTDIVGSTEMATRMGDTVWASLLEQHNATLRSVVSRFQGRIVKSTGDGFMFTFDSPARAIRAADQAIAAVVKLGLHIRASCHTGEVKWSEDDLSGVAVNIASRITDLAGPSQLLVSRTVKDLVAGGPFQFAERGTRTLDGVPGEWQLYEAVVRWS
ncbi:MAG TPA: adenylate/guanylate cyclase domain-containing protein [Acidimicrobiia bacterium]|nr:adenylate/guanylate cyclase domain-containing protein [Acidimicrobiia bacterium]